MSYCTNCGMQIKEGSRFCTQCGFPIKQQSTQNTADNVSPPKTKKKNEFFGTLSSLLGKKNNPSETNSNPTPSVPVLHLKGKPDANGLYPSELVMLSVAEKYKTTETVFPAYLRNTYEIINPGKMLMSLQSKNLIEVGSAGDALNNLKLSDLKSIASALKITVKGNKADIVSQLAKTDEETLSSFVQDRSWKLTENGYAALSLNPYIEFFLKKHPYNTTDVGVDIWTVNKDFVKNPNRPYRDIIYQQLNNKMNKLSAAIQKDPSSKAANTHQYCDCYRLMGLFVEEEGHSYPTAADLYFQYIYKNINVHAGLQFLLNYKFLGNTRTLRNDIINQFYSDIQLYPFQKQELLRLIDELGVEENNIRGALIYSFKRTNDKGIMTESEAADFVLLELSGEIDKSKDLAVKLAKEAAKKVR